VLVRVHISDTVKYVQTWKTSYLSWLSRRPSWDWHRLRCLWGYIYRTLLNTFRHERQVTWVGWVGGHHGTDIVSGPEVLWLTQAQADLSADVGHDLILTACSKLLKYYWIFVFNAFITKMRVQRANLDFKSVMWTVLFLCSCVLMYLGD
jgi:hypothetical protein